MEISKGIEYVRHGHKEGKELSELGVQQAREKAESFFKEIQEASPGSIIYSISSNIGRAVKTKEIIEARLKELAEETKDESVEFIDVHDLEAIQRAKENPDKKYVITNLQPSTGIGYNPEATYSKAFGKYVKLLGGSEGLAATIWATHKEELDELAVDIQEKFPEVTKDQLKPQDYGMTPEEYGLKSIVVLKRLSELTKKHFPERPFKMLAVGHDISSDFATLACLGKDISLKSLKEPGGEFRDFLEGSHFELKDDGIVTKFRGQESSVARTWEEIIDDLKQKSAARKKEWGIE